MKYKSAGLAAVSALAFGGMSALAANMMEIRGFTTGLAVSGSGGKKLESTVGEVSGFATDQPGANASASKGENIVGANENR